MHNFLTKRRVLKCAAVALVLYIVGAVAWVPSVERHQFERFAVEFKRTQTWRYGYVRSHHGAFFVKTRLTADGRRLKPIAAGDTLTPIMARELRLRPWKVAFEIGFYASLWALWSIGLARLRRRLSGPDSTRWRRSVVHGLSWAVMITAELAPFLIAGYGEPLFSNQEGPGALSATTWGFPSTGTAWGYSLTYRGVLQPTLLLAILSLKSTLGFLPPIGIRETCLLVSLVFYFTVATAGKWIVEWLRELGERSDRPGASFGKRGED
jgi:hypothetical protein